MKRIQFYISAHLELEICAPMAIGWVALLATIPESKDFEMLEVLDLSLDR